MKVEVDEVAGATEGRPKNTLPDIVVAHETFRQRTAMRWPLLRLVAATLTSDSVIAGARVGFASALLASAVAADAADFASVGVAAAAAARQPTSHPPEAYASSTGASRLKQKTATAQIDARHMEKVVTGSLAELRSVNAQKGASVWLHAPSEETGRWSRAGFGVMLSLRIAASITQEANALPCSGCRRSFPTSEWPHHVSGCVLRRG